jgi:lysozyme
MKCSDHILGIIQLFEGYEPVALQLKGDRKGVITGGYGTIVHPTGVPVKVGDLFSREYSLECLKFEVDQKCNGINKILDSWSVLLNQNQFDALCCFLYNVGMGGIAPTTSTGNALRNDDLGAFANHMLDWNKGTTYFLGIPRKVTLQGLVDRRNTERKLFLS